MTQRTINEGDKKEWRVLCGRLPNICRCLLQQCAMCDHSLCDTIAPYSFRIITVVANKLKDFCE